MWPCKTQPLQPHHFSQTTLDACTCLGGGVLLHDVNSLSSINISRKLQTGEGNNISGTLAYMLLGWIYITTPGKACQLHSLCILLVYVPFKPPSLSISIAYKFLLTQIYIYIYIYIQTPVVIFQYFCVSRDGNIHLSQNVRVILAFTLCEFLHGCFCWYF
jgi:hypothetical protein